MPGLNRKGPNGDGPMTGRKKGKCKSDNSSSARMFRSEETQNRRMKNRCDRGGGFLEKGRRRRNRVNGED